MSNDTVQHHLAALSRAVEYADLGARLRTIEYLTGLPHAKLRRLLADLGQVPARGRAPDSGEWIHTAPVLMRMEASVFVGHFRCALSVGLAPADALRIGFKGYRAVQSIDPRISFDRAFDLASRILGAWTASTPTLFQVVCPSCRGAYVSPSTQELGQAEECPFCVVVLRYRCDMRVQARFPTRQVPFWPKNKSIKKLKPK